MSIGKSEIENRFGFHRGTLEGPNATAPRHAALRMEFRAFAEHLDEVLADGREKSLAFTALQEASMWSHFCIASSAPLVDES
jgi:hypothetical protein